MQKDQRIDHKRTIVGLRVVVVKAVKAPIKPAFLRDVLQAAALDPALQSPLGTALGTSGGPAELTVRVTGDRELRRLNREFMSEDHTTDVLSFPSGDATTGYLGDIALSWPAVVRQSAQYGHPAETEAALLVVHGLLHLLGWDHATTAQERAMTRITVGCLATSGLRLPPARL